MVLYDCFKLIYAYLKERDKVPECYSCLKMIVQAHLHVVFFQYFALNVHHLNETILFIYEIIARLNHEMSCD